MSCKHYEAQLIEAAAVAEPVGPALAAHLAACEACSARFANEQALLAAIDAELSLVANSEPTDSFVPRVRAVLQQEVSAVNERRTWFAFWPQAAAVGAIALIAALAITQFRAPRRSAPPTPSASAIVPGRTLQPSTLRLSMPQSLTQQPLRPERDVTPSTANLSALTHSAAAESSTFRRVAAAAPVEPERSQADEEFQAEILVPPDEREALARLVAGLRRHNDGVVPAAALAVASRKAPSPSGPLAAPQEALAQPLEIAELKVDPLRPAEEK